ncbi:MAG: hypothetical protein R8L53_05700, partial [Mariprofundales bacterium]
IPPMRNEQKQLDQIPPSRQLVIAVRRAFEDCGDGISFYCKRNNLDRGSVYKALVGKWNGAKGEAVRKQVISAAMRRSLEV